MDKILGRKCQNCDVVGHSSIDCPKLTGGRHEPGGNTGIKLRVANNRTAAMDRFEDRFAAPPKPRITARLTEPPKREKLTRVTTTRLVDRTRDKSESFLRGAGKFEPELQAKRTRYSHSTSESDEEPLTIQVEYSKPARKTKQRDLDLRFQISTKPDLRYQMKSKPIDAPLIPKYKTGEDLRFAIKRTSLDNKRKKTRPPEYNVAPAPPSEDEDDLLKEVSEIKRSKSGTAFTFDDSSAGEEEEERTGGNESEAESVAESGTESEENDENVEPGVKEEVKEEELSEEQQEEEQEEEGEEQEEAEEEEEEEEVATVKEEKKEEESDTSDDSSSSSSSSSSSESAAEAVEQKPKYIDIRDKYDSKPVSTTPLSTRLQAKPEAPKAPHSRHSPKRHSPKAPPKRYSPKRHSPKARQHKTSKTEVKREAPSTDESDEGSTKKPTQKRVKVASSKSLREQLISKDRLLQKDEDSNDSFSDDGEVNRSHSGALAPKDDEEEEEKDETPPEKPKIVPIFPFKTNCKPSQFPDSKVPFIDSHCHIDYLFVREQNYGTFASYVDSKDFPKNFSGCVANFCDPPAWGKNQMYEDILEEDGVWAAFGLHPHNARHWNSEIEANLIKACSHPKCVAWGEIGLDYGKGYSETSPDVIELQKDAFIIQLKHALRLKKPIVIHARGAEMDAFEILKEKLPRDHRIHFHCYTGMWTIAKKMIDYFPNMFIGITGLVTYNTATDVREVSRKVPLDRLLVETDAPYMKPSNAQMVDQDSPRTASPAMGIWTAHKIAELRCLELDDVLQQVRTNVRNMYGI